MNTPIKVLHVGINFERRRGGGAQAPFSICSGLRARGVDAQVAAVYYPGNGQPLLTEDHPEIPAHLFPGSFPARFTNSRDIRVWLRDAVTRYDLVEVHEIFGFPPVYAARAAAAAGVPYLLNPHGSFFPGDLRKRALLKRLTRPFALRPMLRHATAIKAATQMEADQMVTYGERAEKVIVPLPAEALPGPGDGPRFRRAHGIPDGAVVALCVARFDRVKGLEALIDALAAVKQRVPQLWFVLAGSGEASYEASIRARVASVGMTGWSTLPGFLAGGDKTDAFAAAQFYAQFSLRENFSYTVAQALSAGLPCALSDQIGLAPMAVSAGAGRACPPTAEAIARLLGDFIAARAEWPGMRDKALRVFREQLAPDVTIDRLIALYERVIRGRGARPAGASAI